MKNSRLTVSALILLCLGLGVGAQEAESPTAPPGQAAEPAPAAQPAVEGAEATQEPGRTVEVPGARLRLRLPARYWRTMTREEIAEQARGGCGAPQVPERLLLLLRHRDAQVWLQVWRHAEGFQMRSRDNLERAEKEVTTKIKGQFGDDVPEIKTDHERRDGIIIYRHSYTAISRGQTGCAAGGDGQGKPQQIHVLIADHYVRPADGDATLFRIRALAPAETYAALRPEVEFILSSIEYEGEPAADFFVPDAPEEKLLSPEEISEQPGGGGNYGWLIAAGAVMVVWFLLRRRKQKQEPEV